jgi:hypothetical protein
MLPAAVYGDGAWWASDPRPHTVKNQAITEKTKGLLMGVFAEFFGQIGFLSDIYRTYIGH